MGEQVGEMERSLWVPSFLHQVWAFFPYAWPWAVPTRKEQGEVAGLREAGPLPQPQGAESRVLEAALTTGWEEAGARLVDIPSPLVPSSGLDFPVSCQVFSVSVSRTHLTC